MKHGIPILALLLALALSSCASAGRLVVSPEQARSVAVLTAPSRVGVISRGNMEVADDSLGNAATYLLSKALSINYLIHADTVAQAERFSALEDSVYRVVSVAQAVRKRKLSQIRVPDNVVEFARSHGNRYLLLATHGGFSRTRENYRKETAKQVGATVASVALSVLLGGGAVYVGTPYHDGSTLSVALVDVEERQVFYARTVFSEMPPNDLKTLSYQLKTALVDFYDP